MVMSAVILVAAIAVGIAQGAQEAGPEGLDVYRDPDRLRELIEDPPADFPLVDVRAEAEYLSGHIPGAIHLPYDEIAADPPTDDTDALIVLYCRSGVRVHLGVGLDQPTSSAEVTKVTPASFISPVVRSMLPSGWSIPRAASVTSRVLKPAFTASIAVKKTQ
jgi:hypothetical protein